MDDQKVKWTLNLIKTLKDAQIGESARLESIQKALEENRNVYDSDKKYLKEKFNELQEKNPNSTIEKENLTDSETTESLEQSDEIPVDSQSKETIESQINSDETKTESSSEIETLRKEIQKLQDKNYMIEKYLNQNSGSMARAFGRGVGGVFLFLFGLVMIFALAYHFENLDSSLRGMAYGADPMAVLMIVFVITPGILLSIGGASIYYAIRIISRT